MIFLTAQDIRKQLTLSKHYQEHLYLWVPYIRIRKVQTKLLPDTYITTLEDYHSWNPKHTILEAAQSFAATAEAQALIHSAQEELLMRIEETDDMVSRDTIAKIFNVGMTVARRWPEKGVFRSQRTKKALRPNSTPIEVVLIPKAQLEACFEWILPDIN